MSLIRRLNTISFLLALFSVVPLYSQLSTVNVAGDQFSGRIAYFKEAENRTILGSTYISEDWMIGSIETKSGFKADGLFRLNALKKEIEMIIGPDTAILDETFDIETVKLGGLTFISSLTIEKRSDRFFINTHFMNLLSDGKVQLLKKFNIGSYQNLYVPYYMGGAGDGNTYYKMGFKYYYRDSIGSSAYPLVKKRKAIADIFNISIAGVRDIIRENNINLNRESELINLFDILNSK